MYTALPNAGKFRADKKAIYHLLLAFTGDFQGNFPQTSSCSIYLCRYKRSSSLNRNSKSNFNERNVGSKANNADSFSEKIHAWSYTLRCLRNFADSRNQNKCFGLTSGSGLMTMSASSPEVASKPEIDDGSGGGGGPAEKLDAETLGCWTSIRQSWFSMSLTLDDP